MKVSLNWVKKYTEIDIPVAQLCERMTMAGFEVEGVEDMSASVSNVVVGRIEKLEKHPDADKLLICQLNVGNEIVQIVTGADNVFEGALVPVALHNSLLPGGKSIKSGKLRGVVSSGMLCSGEELCLTEDDCPGAEVNGILILTKEYPLGQDILTALGKDDCIVDFSITPNRPDCQSILGMAREIAAVLGKAFCMPAVAYTTVAQRVEDAVAVEVHNADLCPRYMAMGVSNVRIAPSPKWMQDCLLSAGMRPINNIVDITNFVMLETGHPMHAFDARDIAKRTIVVRNAVAGEKLVTLDEKEHTLTGDMLVIADGERCIGLAGVMGGLNSEIKADTTEIIFECAKFRRDNIRKTARTLGIRTDASSLYEKGVDAATVEYAAQRAVSLICELDAGDVLSGAVDINSGVVYKRNIEIDTRDVCKLLGIEIPVQTMSEILARLQIANTVEDTILHCEVPSYRDDIEDAADIAEEVIRIYGYEHIISAPLKAELVIGTKPLLLENTDAVREYLVETGCHEICTYSFIPPKAADLLLLSAEDPRRNGILLRNPLGEDFSMLRTQLFHSMLTVVSTNMSHGVDTARLFEPSVLHITKEQPIVNQPEEPMHICIAAYGNSEDFFTLKGVVQGILDMYNVNCHFNPSTESFLHPYRQAEILVNQQKLGYIGQVHPLVCENYELAGEVYIAQINLMPLVRLGRKNIVYSPLPKYPAVQRDLAVVLDDTTPVGEIIQCISKAGGSLLKNVELFDIYHSEQLGTDKKSTAFSLEFRASDRTLTVDEVAKLFDKIVRSLEYKVGAKLR